MKTCDLHTHSVFSDGTFTPQEILAEAARTGLSAVALTDHNTTAGLSAFMQAARHCRVAAVPGVEVTADYLGKEIHILGLFIKEAVYDKLETYLSTIRTRKEQANKEACCRLLDAGFSIRPENIFSERNVNRVHFAKELMRCGYVSSVDEAFEGLLSEEQGLYVPPRRLYGFDAIRFLRSIDAVPVLAHPFLNLTVQELASFLPEAKQHGLVAMEAYYSCFSDRETALALSITETFGLLPSGGSDFHGENKPGNRLGTGYGKLCVPFSLYEALK